MYKKIFNSIKHRGILNTLKVGKVFIAEKIIGNIVESKRKKAIEEIKKMNINYILRELPINHNNSFLFALNIKDSGLSRQLIFSDIREELSTKYLINHFISENEIVLDIGSNIGYFAIMEAVIAKKGFVYAIEPVLENYENLKINISLNTLENIKSINAGISDVTKDLEIIVPEKRNWSTFNIAAISQFGNMSHHKEKVKTYSIKDIVKKYLPNKSPTMIRMDVEGYEYEIICGNSYYLNKSKKLKIMVELHCHILSKNQIIEILKTLKNANFKIDKYIINPLFPQNEIPSYVKWLSNTHNKFNDKISNSNGIFHYSLDKLIDNISLMPEDDVKYLGAPEIFLYKN